MTKTNKPPSIWYSKGYEMYNENGKRKNVHVSIAEKALGKTLPLGAVVHHVDENRSNNDPMNLVICPDKAYHNLIHARMRAYAATGFYDWRKCVRCKSWDSPENLSFYKSKWGTQIAHKECARIYSSEWRAKK